MNWINQYWWPLFTALFAVFLLTGFWLMQIAKHFRLAPFDLPFSLSRLALPASEKSFIALLQQINTPENKLVKKYIKQHLLVDYLFMPAAYIGIALLCYKTGTKMLNVGRWIFFGLALLQLLPWLFDVVENSYIWKKLNNPPEHIPESNTEKTGSYQFFQFVVRTKFIIAFIATACSLFGLLYYWIIGAYEKDSLVWLGGLALLLVIPTILGAVRKPQKTI